MRVSFWADILRRLIGSGVSASVAALRVRGAIAYVKLIKGTRRMAMLVCLLVLCAIVVGCGFLLVPVALCLFMPWAPQTKAIVAASIGGGYVVIPVIVMLVLFSDRRWMKASRADRLMRAALRK
jgi:hypothetical protein